MNRIFRNAVFPIMVVILLAFLAQRLLLNNDKSEAPPKNWSSMMADIKTDDVKSLEQNTAANSVKVTIKPAVNAAADAEPVTYTVGIPGDEAWNEVYDAHKDAINITGSETKGPVERAWILSSTRCSSLRMYM